MTRRVLTVFCLAGALLIAGPINAAETPEGGISNGIQVHGHWKIEVFEPDGTLVSVTEFENGLTNSGKVALGSVLSSSHSVGAWRIELSGQPNTNIHPCIDSGGNPVRCEIDEPGAHWVIPPSHSTNLVVSSMISGFQMTGSVTASFDNPIYQVATYLKYCEADVAPDDCLSSTQSTSGTSDITATNLASPASVQAGQIIQVTVTITFS